MASVIKVSVVIPVKNPGRIFRQVLEAALSQKTRFKYEIIIIDSGSTDGTVEYCKKFKKQIKLIQIKPEEFGHGKTRNLGVSKSKGEYVAFLTHDATPCDDCWLQNLINVMDQDKKTAGAFGRHYAYRNASPFLKRDLVNLFDSFASQEKVVSIVDRKKYDQDEQLRRRMHFFSDNNSCIRKSVWKKYPYPDVEYAEDQIWAKTVIEAGYKKAYADKAAVYHSHDYGVIHSFRRAFDESYALYSLFGYHVVDSFLKVILLNIHNTIRDIVYFFRSGQRVGDFHWLIKSPLINFMKYLGYYTGRYADKFPDRFANRISIDRQLKSQ